MDLSRRNPAGIQAAAGKAERPRKFNGLLKANQPGFDNAREERNWPLCPNYQDKIPSTKHASLGISGEALWSKED